VDVNCEGCAGCCLDWGSLGAPEAGATAPREPLGAVDHFVPLDRDEVAAFVDDGLGDALAPRPFRAGDGDETVAVDGRELVAVDGRPLFAVDLRSLPKPVAPFGREERAWLDACAFLDPETLQCRLHGGERYPDTCATYPGENLLLGAETECERVEAVHGGERLVDADPPAEATPAFGPQALGATLFAYPDPEDLDGRIQRVAAGRTSREDRARFVGAAVGSAPGSLAVDGDRAAAAQAAVEAADSWVSEAAATWTAALGERDPGAAADDAPRGDAVEDERGAPPTPGWEAVDDGE